MTRKGSDGLAIGDRMKAYENVSRPNLTNRIPVIIRVDGRAFHTFTRGLVKPYDDALRMAMAQTAAALCKSISGAKFAYTQSDEISILLTNDDTLETQAWFDNDVVKMSSIAASLATVHFNSFIEDSWRKRLPHFDGRAFAIPPAEAVNYMIWRQRDWQRNSLSMMARAHYSQKEVNGKKAQALHEMLHEKGQNWANQPGQHKDGVVVHPHEERGWMIDMAPPSFTKDRHYVGRHIPGWVAPTMIVAE